VAPVLDFERDFNLDTPYSYQNKEAETPTIQVDRNFNPFQEDKKQSSYSFKPKKENQPHWGSLYVGLDSNEVDVAENSFESETVTSSLFSESEVEKKPTTTYQIHKKYIVNPIKSGMLIIDQQRAHQRILYEQFLTNITIHQANSQQLLFPVTLYFSGNEIALIQVIQQSLESTGFVFESINNDSIVISGLPVTVSESEASIVLEQLVSDLQEEVPDSSFSQMDSMAKSMARSLSVKTGTYLTEEAQVNLVNNLFACKEATVSPFNKTTFITLSVEDLDKKFSL
jgi:DNA mismatch repair protein MutL